jgi:hypothetical protein
MWCNVALKTQDSATDVHYLEYYRKLGAAATDIACRNCMILNIGCMNSPFALYVLICYCVECVFGSVPSI